MRPFPRTPYSFSDFPSITAAPSNLKHFALQIRASRDTDPQSSTLTRVCALARKQIACGGIVLTALIVCLQDCISFEDSRPRTQIFCRSVFISKVFEYFGTHV